jgi:outer membrane protein assembly factor BamB
MRAWIVAGVLLSVAAQGEAGPPTIFFDPNAAGGDGFAQGAQSAAATGSGGVLAGAPLASVGGQSRAGVAYVLDAAGRLVRTLQSPNPTTDGMFGAAVLVAGGDLVVSAPGDTASGTAGAGEVYRFDGTTFALKRIYQPPSPQTGLRFGLPLLFDGNNTLYVAAAETLPPTASNAGAIYALDFGSGAFLRSFAAPTPTTGALFGAAFALAGNTLIVGAPGTSVGGQTGAGAAYLLDATSGRLLHPLASPNPTPAGAFGSAIALLGGTPLVGAPGESSAGLGGSGVVYAFDPASGALAHTFTAPIPRAGLGFGAVIAATGTSYFVGVPAAPVGDLDAAGQVYALDPTKGLSQIFQSPSPAANAHFGASLFLTGNALLIGEPGARGATPKLYLFDLAAPPTPGPSPGIGGGVATTTTTLPGDCGAAPTFAALECNLDALDATVARAGLGARLGSRLRVILARARARAQRAQTAGPRRARAALRAVIANVNAFERRWNAASDRLDLGTQKVLLLLAQATRDAARALLAALP